MWCFLGVTLVSRNSPEKNLKTICILSLSSILYHILWVVKKVKFVITSLRKFRQISKLNLIPQPEDAVLHTLLSWLKEEALFGHHHSVPCILNRVEIGKFWHYGLKCGRGGWHRPPESQIGLNSFLPPTRWFCPTLLMNMMMGRCAQLGPCQAHTVLTIKYRGSLSSRPRLTALESNIE